MGKWFLTVLICSFIQVNAQQLNFQILKNGFYTDHVEVLGNRPAVPQAILVNKSGVKINNINPGIETYYIKKEDKIERFNSESFFGYVNNGVFYWNYKGEFYRLGLKGMLSHVVVTETRYTNTYASAGSYAISEQISIAVDFKTGNSFAFEPEPFEAFLMANNYELYQEFSAIKKRRDKKRALFMYLKKYNDSFNN